MSFQKKLNVYSELFESEKLYVHDLTIWCVEFKKALLSYEGFSSGKRTRFAEVIFANLDRILNLHKNIVRDMAFMNERCRQKFVKNVCDSLGCSLDGRMCFKYNGGQKKYDEFDEMIFSLFKSRVLFDRKHGKKLMDDSLFTEENVREYLARFCEEMREREKLEGVFNFKELPGCFRDVENGHVEDSVYDDEQDILRQPYVILDDDTLDCDNSGQLNPQSIASEISHPDDSSGRLGPQNVTSKISQQTNDSGQLSSQHVESNILEKANDSDHSSPQFAGSRHSEQIDDSSQACLRESAPGTPNQIGDCSAGTQISKPEVFDIENTRVGCFNDNLSEKSENADKNMKLHDRNSDLRSSPHSKSDNFVNQAVKRFNQNSLCINGNQKVVKTPEDHSVYTNELVDIIPANIYNQPSNKTNISSNGMDKVRKSSIQRLIRSFIPKVPTHNFSEGCEEYVGGRTSLDGYSCEDKHLHSCKYGEFVSPKVNDVKHEGGKVSLDEYSCEDKHSRSFKKEVFVSSKAYIDKQDGVDTRSIFSADNTTYDPEDGPKGLATNEPDKAQKDTREDLGYDCGSDMKQNLETRSNFLDRSKSHKGHKMILSDSINQDRTIHSSPLEKLKTQKSPKTILSDDQNVKNIEHRSDLPDQDSLSSVGASDGPLGSEKRSPLREPSEFPGNLTTSRIGTKNDLEYDNYLNESFIDGKDPKCGSFSQKLGSGVYRMDRGSKLTTSELESPTDSVKTIMQNLRISADLGSGQEERKFMGIETQGTSVPDEWDRSTCVFNSKAIHRSSVIDPKKRDIPNKDTFGSLRVGKKNMIDLPPDVTTCEFDSKDMHLSSVTDLKKRDTSLRDIRSHIDLGRKDTRKTNPIACKLNDQSFGPYVRSSIGKKGTVQDSKNGSSNETRGVGNNNSLPFNRIRTYLPTPREFLYTFYFRNDDIYQDLAPGSPNEELVYSDLCYEAIYEKYVAQFSVYQAYAYQMPKISFLLDYELQKNKEFKEFIENFLTSRGNLLGPKHFIARPTQKLIRYPLLFGTLKKAEESTLTAYLQDHFTKETKKINSQLTLSDTAFANYKLFLFVRFNKKLSNIFPMCLYARHRKLIRVFRNMLVRSYTHVEPKSFTLLLFDHILVITDEFMDGTLLKYLVTDIPIYLPKIRVREMNYQVKGLQDYQECCVVSEEAKKKYGSLDNPLNFEAVNDTNERVDSRCDDIEKVTENRYYRREFGRCDPDWDYEQHENVEYHRIPEKEGATEVRSLQQYGEGMESAVQSKANDRRSSSTKRETPEEGNLKTPQGNGSLQNQMIDKQENDLQIPSGFNSETHQLQSLTRAHTMNRQMDAVQNPRGLDFKMEVQNPETCQEQSFTRDDMVKCQVNNLQDPGPGRQESGNGPINRDTTNTPENQRETDPESSLEVQDSVSGFDPQRNSTSPNFVPSNAGGMNIVDFQIIKSTSERNVDSYSNSATSQVQKMNHNPLGVPSNGETKKIGQMTSGMASEVILDSDNTEYMPNNPQAVFSDSSTPSSDETQIFHTTQEYESTYNHIQSPIQGINGAELANFNDTQSNEKYRTISTQTGSRKVKFNESTIDRSIESNERRIKKKIPYSDRIVKSINDEDLPKVNYNANEEPNQTFRKTLGGLSLDGQTDEQFQWLQSQQCCVLEEIDGPRKWFFYAETRGKVEDVGRSVRFAQDLIMAHQDEDIVLKKRVQLRSDTAEVFIVGEYTGNVQGYREGLRPFKSVIDFGNTDITRVDDLRAMSEPCNGQKNMCRVDDGLKRSSVGMYNRIDSERENLKAQNEDLRGVGARGDDTSHTSERCGYETPDFNSPKSSFRSIFGSRGSANSRGYTVRDRFIPGYSHSLIREVVDRGSTKWNQRDTRENRELLLLERQDNNRVFASSNPPKNHGEGESVCRCTQSNIHIASKSSLREDGTDIPGMSRKTVDSRQIEENPVPVEIPSDSITTEKPTTIGSNVPNNGQNLEKIDLYGPRKHLMPSLKDDKAYLNIFGDMVDTKSINFQKNLEIFENRERSCKHTKDTIIHFLPSKNSDRPKESCGKSSSNLNSDLPTQNSNTDNSNHNSSISSIHSRLNTPNSKNTLPLYIQKPLFGRRNQKDGFGRYKEYLAAVEGLEIVKPYFHDTNIERNNIGLETKQRCESSKSIDCEDNLTRNNLKGIKEKSRDSEISFHSHSQHLIDLESHIGCEDIRRVPLGEESGTFRADECSYCNRCSENPNFGGGLDLTGDFEDTQKQGIHPVDSLSTIPDARGQGDKRRKPLNPYSSKKLESDKICSNNIHMEYNDDTTSHRSQPVTKSEHVRILHTDDLEQSAAVHMFENNIGFKIHNPEVIHHEDRYLDSNADIFGENSFIIYVIQNEGIFANFGGNHSKVYHNPCYQITYIKSKKTLLFIENKILKSAYLDKDTRMIIPETIENCVGHYWYSKTRTSEYLTVLKYNRTGESNIHILKGIRKGDKHTFETFFRFACAQDVQNVSFNDESLILMAKDIILLELTTLTTTTFLNPLDSAMSLITLDCDIPVVLDFFKLGSNRFLVCCSNMVYTVNGSGVLEENSLIIPFYDAPLEFRVFGENLVVLTEGACIVYSLETGDVRRWLPARNLRFLRCRTPLLLQDDDYIYEMTMSFEKQL